MPRLSSSTIWRIIPLAALIVVIFILQLPSELRVRLEAVNAPRPDFGSQTVIVSGDERIFTLFAALNAAGFDREYQGIPMSPIRQQIRAELNGRDLPSLKHLKPYFDRIPDYQLVVWALQRGPAPEFGRAEAGWWVTTRAATFDGLSTALSDFYKEADIADLWQQVGPQYAAEIAHWKPLAETSLTEIQTYLGVTELPFHQLVVIPNPLDSYYSGNGPQINVTAYVVAGPTETDLSMKGLIEHEILHSIIGPMLDKNLSVIPSAQRNRLYAVLKKSMPSGYGTWSSAVEVSLIRAMVIRMLNGEALRNTMIEQEENNGFLLIRPLSQALEMYEQSHQSFEKYLPTLLETINNIQLP